MSESPSLVSQPWPSLSASELYRLSLDLPPLEYLVADLLPRVNGVHLWSGLPDAGKSLSGLSLALSVSLGLPCWNSLETLQSQVVYVDLEQSRRLVAHRLPRVMNGLGIGAADDLHLVQLPTIDVMKGHLQGLDKRMREIEDTTGRPIPLVIFDTLSASHSLDENKGDMSRVMGQFRGLAETKESDILLLAHNRKESPIPLRGYAASLQSIRGNTAIPGGTDSHFNMTRISESEIRIDQGKTRLYPVAPFRLRIEGRREDSHVRVVHAGAAAPQRKTKAEQARCIVREALEAAEWVSKDELLDQGATAGVSKKTMEDAVAFLGHEIVRESRGKKAWYSSAPRSNGGQS